MQGSGSSVADTAPRDTRYELTRTVRAIHALTMPAVVTLAPIATVRLAEQVQLGAARASSHVPAGGPTL